MWARKHPDVLATTSMKRRMVHHDYQGRAIYLITLCVWKDEHHGLAPCVIPTKATSNLG